MGGCNKKCVQAPNRLEITRGYSVTIRLGERLSQRETAPGEKGSAADAESRNERDKSKETCKLGRTKEKAGGVGYLSSLWRPVARSPTEATAINAGNVLLLLRHKKVKKSPLLA